jgi:class 3 adenylate cyclase
VRQISRILSVALFAVLLFGQRLTAEPAVPLFAKYSVQRFALDSIIDSIRHDYSRTISELNNIENIAEQKGDVQLQNLAQVIHYRYLLNNEKFSAEQEIRSLEIAKNQTDYLKADALQLLADFYWTQKNYTGALENYINAYNLYSKYDTAEFSPKSDYLTDYGGKFYYFGDYSSAKNIFLEALQAMRLNKVQISRINTVALCYDFLGQRDSAELYFNKAMDVAERQHDETWVGILSGNIADIYYKRGEYDKAGELLERSIELCLKNTVLQNAVYSLSLLGDVYLAKGNQKKALELELQAYEIIKKKNKWSSYIVVRRVYPFIAKAYAANGNTALAYAFLDSASAAKDSVAKERSVLLVTGAQHKAEVQKHMAEISEKELALKKQTVIRNSFIGGFAIVALFSVVVFRQKKRISYEKKRSDELLHNILPEETAEELKINGSAEAKSYDLVTVMFTDFKDFTQASETMGAKELVKEINLCYSEFDKIIDEHNIEKIKTIGDSYMCAGGLPVINKTNAVDVVRAAMEIQQFMHRHMEEREQQGRSFFQIRIGIHTGSVVAGIVGIRKFAYDIWGDTVNIASRMESSGEAGKINISGSTYELIRDKFSCVHRGKIEAKNKGQIEMYFVEGVL